MSIVFSKIKRSLIATMNNIKPFTKRLIEAMIMLIRYYFKSVPISLIDFKVPKYEKSIQDGVSKSPFVRFLNTFAKPVLG
jgi:hypothetical protein